MNPIGCIWSRMALERSLWPSKLKTVAWDD